MVGRMLPCSAVKKKKEKKKKGEFDNRSLKIWIWINIHSVDDLIGFEWAKVIYGLEPFILHSKMYKMFSELAKTTTKRLYLRLTTKEFRSDLMVEI